MALSDARVLALAQAVLTLVDPKHRVTIDPGGVVTDLQAVATLTAEVVIAEGASVDADAAGLFRLFKGAAWIHGPLRATIEDLRDRVVVLAP